ncbi:MAG: hypothetical protein EPN47_18515 [Acidobacteria bacterium]|nr:MAG: hypothetical protein EPN47_18515 [Acidobacteriota bacterium]
MEKIGKEMVVVPPPYSKLAPGKTVRFEIQADKRAHAERRNGCSAASGPFKLAATPQEWNATLPSLRTWSRETESGVFHRNFESFVRQISALADKGCISAPEALKMETGLREAVPIAVSDTMLYRYGYSAGEGVIDLEPGMRLTIQRAEYNRSDEFQGTETVYYRIRRDSEARLQIHVLKSEHRGQARMLPGDLDLADRIRGDFHARLFFSGNLVPRNLSYSALVVGTRALQKMDAIASELRKHPQDGCPAGSDGDPGCRAYFGMVTVVAELGVKVNGREVFVAPGDHVRDALEKAGKTGCIKDVRALRIEREFLGHPVKVAFDPTSDAILHMELVAVDRISCSASRHYSPEQ